jgi:anti-sigma B factor antagonist
MDEPVQLDGTPELNITVKEPSDDTVVVHLAGELDLVTTHTLQERLWPLFDRPRRAVLLDLTEVTFLGSTGLADLVNAKERAGRSGIRLLLVATGRVVLRPLEATGLMSIFPVYDSIDAALAASYQGDRK